MSAPKVDVRGILERAGANPDAPEGSQAWALAQADAAVTKLIEASTEYRRGTECHVCDCVYCHDRNIRMDDALARIGGVA